MFAIPMFLLIWLGGSITASSASAGFHTAAVLFLSWSWSWTFVAFILAIFGKIKFVSFLFWNGLGLAAAFCLTLGRVEFIVVGIILWIISVIVEILTISDLTKV